jgi:hypothetical protein
LPNVYYFLRLELWRRGEDLGLHPEDLPRLKQKFQSLKFAYFLLPNVCPLSLRLKLWRRGEDLGPHPEDPPHLREKFQSLKLAYLLLHNVSLSSGRSCGGGGRTWVPTQRIHLISRRKRCLTCPLSSDWSCGGGGMTGVPTQRIRSISGRNSGV